MNDLVILIVIYAVVFVSSPLIAILHELGHAFAYLIFTKPDKIDIYIGSYVLEKNPIHFSAGKLDFYIKRSFPFVKGIGLCRSNIAETNYLKFIVILLAGPFYTLIAAGILSIIAFNIDGHLLIKISCYIFLGLSAVSLMVNLIPSEIDKFNKVKLDNDGKQILLALKIRNARPDYVEALLFLDNGDYTQAILRLENVIALAPHITDKVLKLLITASIKEKLYDNAARYLDDLERNFKLTAEDIFNRGYLYSVALKHHEAITNYSAVLKKEKNHIYALNNIGYELIEQGAYEVATRALDRATKLKPKFDSPYAGLGCSKILQNDLEEGKKLVDKCLELNIENAYAYKALGIYYLKLKNIKLANSNFNRAIELDATIDLTVYTDELKLLEEQNII